MGLLFFTLQRSHTVEFDLVIEWLLGIELYIDHGGLSRGTIFELILIEYGLHVPHEHLIVFLIDWPVTQITEIRMASLVVLH